MISGTKCTRISFAIGIGLLALVLIAGWLVFSHENSCNVAYIQLNGELVDYIPPLATSTTVYVLATSTDATPVTLDETSSEDVTKSIREAAADPHIKAIVLSVDSWGGYPVAGDEIEAALKLVQKPTVALIRSDGESAAYKAATGADYIFASDDSGVGGIGVTASYTDQSKQDAMEGITFNQLSVGKFKDIMNVDKPLTADERNFIMGQLQIQDKSFIQMVATNRHISVEYVTDLADGTYELGNEALSDGLIDQIGTIDDVRTYLAQKLGIKATICNIDTQ